MRAIALMDQGIGRYCPSTGVDVPDPGPPGGDGPEILEVLLNAYRGS